jgi:hypothetical protein
MASSAGTAYRPRIAYAELRVCLAAAGAVVIEGPKACRCGHRRRWRRRGAGGGPGALNQAAFTIPPRCTTSGVSGVLVALPQRAPKGEHEGRDDGGTEHHAQG